ncbi:MAG: CynX/NimT family MFS transporter [Thermomicrobiales bacterium]
MLFTLPKVEPTIATSAPVSPSIPAARSRVFTVLLVFGVLITALNLRIVIIAISPMLEQIRATTGISSTAAGLLTTLPVLCFGLFAHVAPQLARRFGLDLVLWGTMVVLTAGIAIRIMPTILALFVGTAVIGMAIGIANVLLPASIKRDFPHNAGPMTGLLTMAMSASGTIGVGLTIPMQNLTGFSWQGTLGLWGLLSAVAIVALLPRLRLNTPLRTLSGSANSRPTISLWRDRLAWQVTILMGLQSFIFYSLVAWFPSMMGEHGVSNEHAGLLLSLANLAGFVSSFFVPVMASRRRDQRAFVTGTALVWIVSIVGIMIFPTTGILLWMVLFGGCAGSALSLSLSFFSLRSPDTNHAAQLSGMAQTVGYCLAATGPFLFGAAHDLTGTWDVPLIGLILAMVGVLFAGLGAGRNRQVGQTPTLPS